MSITKQLLQAIESSGQTLYRVAKDAGVGYSALHGFVNDERDVKLSTAERLAEHLGLELAPKARKGGRR